MSDKRTAELHRKMKSAGDPADAAAQKAYHKSPLKFHGLKADVQRAILREVFPKKPAIPRAELEPVIRELWTSDWFDERIAALSLLDRIAGELEVGDLPWIKEMASLCDGWALLDTLAFTALGPMGMRLGEPVYRVVRKWSDDDWMWTRRAAILIHALPARRGMLNHEYSWPTWEERLFEKEFFIRKAIGWALRESCKHYPREVCDFLLRVGDRASGLTRREGARTLPEKMRIRILGK
ncbi:MAG: DNA alkylation repair protein [bacterium]